MLEALYEGIELFLNGLKEAAVNEPQIVTNRKAKLHMQLLLSSYVPDIPDAGHLDWW